MLKYAHRGEGTRNPTTLDLEGFDELIQTLKTRGLSDFHPRMVAHAKEMIAPLYSFADSLRYPKSSAHRNDRDVAKGWSTLRLALLLEEASFKVREQIENKHCAE